MSRHGTPDKGAFGRVFAIPALLALATATGLLSALLGDGVWNVVSWVAMAVPLGVILRHLGRPAGR